MPIPVFMAEIRPASTDYVQSEGGSTQALPTSAYYFMSTSKTSSGNGRCLQNLLAALLNASSAVVWTVTLTSDLKLKFVHDSGSPVDLTMDGGLALALGMSSYGLATVGTPWTSTSVPATTGVTAPYRSWWIWCPEMVISSTSPDLFDPMLTTGIKSSAGAASRAPDMTASFVANGTQVEAGIFFRGVSPYYRAHPNLPGTTTGLNEDFVTFWEKNLRLGRRVLMWRDRADIVGNAAPYSSSGTLDYLEFYPDANLRARPGVKAAVEGNLGYWDISLTLWLTERGEAVYS